jgi:hypothetical protein
MMMRTRVATHPEPRHEMDLSRQFLAAAALTPIPQGDM